MEKQESKSKWDDLAREIGAEIPPETIQREEAVATGSQGTTAPAGRTHEPTKSKAPLPKRSATDWNSLVTDLGLPPLEEPEPVVAAAPVVPEMPKQLPP